MHDTFLNQNLYETIVTICRENSIFKVKNLVVTVHADSHVNKDSIKGHFAEEGNPLIGDFTDIEIKKCGAERLCAIIEQIDGEK
jgi:hypothetical protein